MEDAHVKLSVQCWRRCTRETQQIPIKQGQQATTVPNSRLEESYTDANFKQAAHQGPNSLQG